MSGNSVGVGVTVVVTAVVLVTTSVTAIFVFLTLNIVSGDGSDIGDVCSQIHSDQAALRSRGLPKSLDVKPGFPQFGRESR